MAGYNYKKRVLTDTPQSASYVGVAKGSQLASDQIEGIVRRRRGQSQAKEEKVSYDYSDYQAEMASQGKSLRDSSPKPMMYEDVVSRLQNPKKAESLKSDEAFMTRLEQMKKDFPGLTEREVFKIIEGESNYNPTAKSKAGAVGLFQMMEEPLAELGFTPEEVMAMAPAEQLAVYSGYLKRWGYDGSFGLGIVQAAPAYRNASPDTVVYKKGSKEWKQNPGWRSRNNGDITKRSIENYYGRVE